jgi:hypothetical protein
MENKIIVVLTPMGMVIGRMAEGTLTSPKVLNVMQGKDPHSVSVSFKSILGDPELFFIGNSCYYISENPEINELYIEAATGIKIARSPIIDIGGAA